MSQDDSGFDASDETVSQENNEQPNDNQHIETSPTTQGMVSDESQQLKQEADLPNNNIQLQTQQPQSEYAHIEFTQHYQYFQSPEYNTSDQTGTTHEAITSPSYQYNSWTDEAAEDEEQLTVSQLEEPQNFLDLYSTFVCLQLSEQEVLQFYFNFQSQMTLEEILSDENQNVFNLQQNRKTKIKYLLTKKRLYALYNLSKAFSLFSEQVNITNDVIQVVVLIKLQIRAFQLCKIDDFEVNGYYLPSLSVQTVPIIQKIVKRFQMQLYELCSNYKTPYDEDLGLKSVRNQDVDRFIERKPNCEVKRRQAKLMSIFDLEQLEVSTQTAETFQKRLRYKINLEDEQIAELRDYSAPREQLLASSFDTSASLYSSKLQERLSKAEEIQNSKQYYNSQDRPDFIQKQGFRSYLEKKEEKGVLQLVQLRLSKRNERALQKRTPNELYNDVQEEFRRELASGMYRSGTH